MVHGKAIRQVSYHGVILKRVNIMARNRNCIQDGHFDQSIFFLQNPYVCLFIPPGEPGEGGGNLPEYLPLVILPVVYNIVCYPEPRPLAALSNSQFILVNIKIYRKLTAL